MRLDPFCQLSLAFLNINPLIYLCLYSRLHAIQLKDAASAVWYKITAYIITVSRETKITFAGREKNNILKNVKELSHRAFSSELYLVQVLECLIFTITHVSYSIRVFSNLRSSDTVHAFYCNIFTKEVDMLIIRIGCNNMR